MNIRPKTLRRLLVLFVGFAFLCGGVTLLLVRSVRKKAATVAGMRALAFRAYDARDDAAAVKLFAGYINSGTAASNDAEAVYAYGMARAQVPTEGNRHIAEAINLLQKYLDLAPTDPHDAGHQLLKLYSQARYNKEARTLAAKMLARNPRDAEALRAEVTAMLNERNFAEALPACHALNQINPTDPIWQDRELKLMDELKQPHEQIIAHARQLLDAHPQDPRFLAVMAMAYGLAGDDAKAAESIEAAAKCPSTDATTALQLIYLLQRGPRPYLADDLLDRAAAQFNDPNLQELSVRRMFERGQYAAIVAKLKDLDRGKSRSNRNLVAYDAIAEYETGRHEAADALVADLSARRDPSSSAWAAALRAHFALPSLEPSVAIKAYHAAMEQDRGNPVVPYFLGDAQAQLGEFDDAIRSWNVAARLSRTWAMPLYRISRALSSSGRSTEALAVATSLIHRAPGSLESQVAYSIAAWRRIQNNPAELRGEAGSKLLADFELIRARVPREPDTLAAHAALLSRRGDRDKAMGIVKSAIASPIPLPETAFEQLLQASQQEHWELESQILQAAEQAHGLTPGIAFDRAIALHRNGQGAEALQQLDALLRTHPNDVIWQLDGVRFRDATGQPDAAQRWVRLGDAYPNDIRVQYAALSAPCRFADRAFWQRTIDRVKNLTGVDGQEWQIEQARFTLAKNPTPQQIANVIDSLEKILASSPELADVHHLLAEALLLTNSPDDLSKATTELAAVHNERPKDFQTTTELAALLVSRGMRQEALALLDTVCLDPGMSAAQHMWAASTYGELGNFDAGIKLLSSEGAPADGPDRDVLLASLYARAGRTDDAAKLYQQVAGDHTSSASNLLAAANFFAATHQPDHASRCVSRLQDMKLSPDSLELLRAQLEELEGHPDVAAGILADGTRAYPQSQGLWQARCGLGLRSGKLGDAEKIAGAGLSAIPSDPALTAMRSEIAQLRSIDVADAQLLLDSVSREPQAPAVEQTLSALADGKAHALSPQQSVLALRPLADRYPRFLPIQEILARRYLDLRDLSDAQTIASRAADLNPGNPQPLKLLIQVEVAQGDWEIARATAVRWRQSLPANPLDADLEIARTYLQQPDANPGAAIEQLKTYEGGDAPEPQKLAALPLYCAGLLALGRTDEAAERLQPLVAKSPQWAATWMALAVSSKDASTAAQWLERLAAFAPADSEPKQIALADAWVRVGVKFDSPTAHEKAREILRPVIAGTNVPPAGWKIWALSSQLSGNLPDAERGWMALVDADPKDSSARNNLAFVLLLEGGAERLARAESLARQAIAAAPEASTFYDTLARIQALLGKPSDAVRNFRVALEKDPNDIEAMIGLADVLQSQPAGREEARSLLTRINTMIDGGTPLMRPIRKQLDHVKTELSSSIGTSG